MGTLGGDRAYGVRSPELMSRFVLLALAPVPRCQQAAITLGAFIFAPSYRSGGFGKAVQGV
jgi:hypothetical protein